MGLLAAAAACAVVPCSAQAHSASDAYLSLDARADGSVELQWDIAVRDLDFVLGLDDDGDGAITWAELRRHHDAIARYALAHLKLQADASDCPLVLTRQWVDTHADGAYVALFAQARCGAGKKALSLSYGLFFDIDPSHRAILVAHAGADTATAVVSPQNAHLALPLPPAPARETLP
jgi:hypothetical protein